MSLDDADLPPWGELDLTQAVEVNNMVERLDLADIYDGVWNAPNGSRKVSVKVIRTDTSITMAQRVFREIRVWHSLSHPNLYPVLGVHLGFRDFPAIVSPWCEHGNIVKYLKSRTGDPALDVVRLKLLIDVVHGLEYLHENGVVHGDIRGMNVLITDDAVAQLSDMGLYTIIADYEDGIEEMIAARWTAPEQISDDTDSKTFQSDIWSLGCLFFEAFSGQPPYSNFKSATRGVIATVSRGVGPHEGVDLSEDGTALVSMCCKFDPNKRATIPDILSRLEFFKSRKAAASEPANYRLEEHSSFAVEI